MYTLACTFANRNKLILENTKKQRKKKTKCQFISNNNDNDNDNANDSCPNQHLVPVCIVSLSSSFIKSVVTSPERIQSIQISVQIEPEVLIK